MADQDLTRRGFLMTAGTGLLAAAAHGVPLAPPDGHSAMAPVPAGSTKKVGYAVVGLGQLALEEVLPAFGEAVNSRPVALVSGDPAKARKVADFYGIDPARIYNYESFERMKDDPAIGVVYNILPNHLHAEYTVRALKIGKDVLCEKPMTATVDESRLMVAAAAEHKRKLMCAYRLRYEPFNVKAIEILRSGELGKIRTIEAQNMQDTKPPNIRLSTKTAGGPLGDVGIYCLNAFRYLTGEEPAEASAMVHKPADEERFAEVPENVSFQLTFPSGVLATAVCGFGSRESRWFRVNCSKGWLELENAFGYRGQKLRVAREKQVTEVEVRPYNHFACEMDHFSRCVMEDKPPLTPGEEGLRDIVAMSWIDEAARTGQRVKLSDSPPNADKVRAVAK